MTTVKMMDALDARVERRNERRDFFKAALGAAAVAGAGATALTWTTPVGAQTAPSDADILNFALQLEYLEAQFYSFAANGTGLPDDQLTGTGTRGAVRGGRRVNFTDPLVAQYAREIAADEIAHVRFLRQALGSAAVAQPAVDIDVTPTSAFSNAARAAGLIGAGQSFDVYANDDNFLLGAYIFEDVGVTAYKGAAPLISNTTFLDASAGILAAEAFHAGIIRLTLYNRGVTVPAARSATEAISNARDSLDGSSDIDQGVAPQTANGQTIANIAPTDANGIAFSRTPGQTLNIVFLTGAAASAGGFFPNGVNGALRTSTANA